MAWPPPVLPINITNATPQLNIHPANHNNANQAINDTVTRVGDLINTVAALDIELNKEQSDRADGDAKIVKRYGVGGTQTSLIWNPGVVRPVTNFTTAYSHGSASIEDSGTAVDSAFTVPVGGAGVWALNVFVRMNAAPNGMCDVTVDQTGAATTAAAFIPANKFFATVSVIQPMTDGQALLVGFYNGSTTPLTPLVYVHFNKVA